MSYLANLAPQTLFDSMDIAEATKQDYLARLPQFLGFVHRNGITRDLLLDYKKYLRERSDLGIASKNKYLAVARIALRELYRQGKVSADLSLGVKSFQQSSKHKVYGLTQDEVGRICEFLQLADDSFPVVRLRMLVALLLFQGLRQIEVCRLDVNDVDLVNSTLLILGKGRDDKEHIHLHPETIKALMVYLKASQVKDGPLFTSLASQKSGRRLSTRGLRLIVKQLFHNLEIDRVVHSTRHFYATELIHHYKSDLTTVARYTRHRNLEMLTVYNDALASQADLVDYSKVFENLVLVKTQ